MRILGRSESDTFQETILTPQGPSHFYTQCCSYRPHQNIRIFFLEVYHSLPILLTKLKRFQLDFVLRECGTRSSLRTFFLDNRKKLWMSALCQAVCSVSMQFSIMF